MGGEGHMLDMIRRLKEGRDSSRLRRERTSEKMKRLRAGDSSMPDSTPEEMGRIIRQTAEKKEADDQYFVSRTLIAVGVLMVCAVIVWAIFIR